jgi:integrase/recombinase XerD
MKNLDWQTAIQQFRTYLLLERSLAAHSIEAYEYDVEKLHQYLLIHHLDHVQPLQVTTAQIENMLAWLHELGIGAASQARILSGLKSFYKYLLVEDYLNVAPTDPLDAPRLGKKIPDVLAFEEIEQLLLAIDLSEPQGQRDRAMLETLYACGLRVSELVGLKISNLFLAEALLKVEGKGNKERLVPIGGEAVKQLQIYLKYARPLLSKIDKSAEDTVFLNARGKGLSRIWVFMVIKALAEKVGLTKNISPHTFRHSFATHLVEGGADLRVVQDLLGHESITTTEIYTHLDTEFLRDTIQTFHPRNRRQ